MYPRARTHAGPGAGWLRPAPAHRGEARPPRAGDGQARVLPPNTLISIYAYISYIYIYMRWRAFAADRIGYIYRDEEHTRTHAHTLHTHTLSLSLSADRVGVHIQIRGAHANSRAQTTHTHTHIDAPEPGEGGRRRVLRARAFVDPHSPTHPPTPPHPHTHTPSHPHTHTPTHCAAARTGGPRHVAQDSPSLPPASRRGHAPAPQEQASRPLPPSLHISLLHTPPTTTTTFPPVAP